jgi:nitrile hydratase accessory protein
VDAAEQSSLKPLAAVDGQPAFDEPWQAQVLAIADTLVRSGLFSPGEWSAALGVELKTAQTEGAEDSQETYYRCALNALESLVAGISDIDAQAMASKREDWEKAYRSTPHGEPVVLDVQ